MLIEKSFFSILNWKIFLFRNTEISSTYNDVSEKHWNRSI